MHVESSVHEKKQKNGWVSIDWQTFFTMCTSKIQKHATVYVFVILGFYWKTWFVVIFIGFMAPLSKGFVVSQAFEQPATTNRKTRGKKKKKTKKKNKKAPGNQITPHVQHLHGHISKIDLHQVQKNELDHSFLSTSKIRTFIAVCSGFFSFLVRQKIWKDRFVGKCTERHCVNFGETLLFGINKNKFVPCRLRFPKAPI